MKITLFGQNLYRQVEAITIESNLQNQEIIDEKLHFVQDLNGNLVIKIDDEGL